MNFQIDSGKLLYALGVLFAAAALLYFVRDVVFGLSITVKAALLLLAFVAFLVAGVGLQRDVLDAVAFTLAGVAYVVFVGYVVLRYEPSETGTFLLLALSASLFVGLGYGIRQGDLTVTRRQATTVGGVLLVLGVALVGVDAAGGGVSYAFETEETVTVDPVRTDDPTPYSETERRIGTLTATNEFVFTRALALPPVRGCLAGPVEVPRTEVWVSYEFPSYERPDTIAGGTTREFAVQASIPVDRNQTESVTYAIERGPNCDVERDRPTLIVTESDDSGLD